MEPTERGEDPVHYSARKEIPCLAGAMGTNSRNPGSPDGVGPGPHKLLMDRKGKAIKMAPDKSC